MTRPALHPTLLRVALAVCLLVPATAPAAATAAQGDTLVVDADGDADYETISAALDAADDGDRVVVRPGVYRERLTIDANVTVVAPRGATLNGSTFVTSDPNVDSVGIEAGADGDWTVTGFRFVDYTVAVDAGGDGDWTLRDVRIENASWFAVNTGGADGDWTVRNLTVVTTENAIAADGTDGDWTVRNATLRDVEMNAVDATGAEGDWTVRGLTVDGALVGVNAVHASGDWTVRDATVRNVTVGVGALNASGNWTVRDATVRDVTVSERYDFWQPPLREGVAVHASRTSGRWTVRNATLAGSEADVLAREADPAGLTTAVDWGASGADCEGNVTCAPGGAGRATLTPTATPSPDGTVSSTRGTATATDAAPATDDTPTGTTQPLSPLAVAVAALAVVLARRR